MSSNAPFTILFVGFMIGVFILGFFAVLIRHIFYRTSGITADQIATLIPRGLDNAIINRLPTFLYSDVKYFKIVKGALECAICLNEFDDDETLRLLPICDHVFHPECIDAWLSSHTTCPVCRANLAETNSHEFNPVFNISTVESDRESLTIGVAEEVVDDELIRSSSIKSTKWSKFPRSHSTGHSLVRPCENVDRFTLKLPDQIRRDIMTRGLNQTKSLTALARETSSRRGYRESYRRLGSLDRPDRWMVSMAPLFFSRESSVRNSNQSTSGSEGGGKGFNLVGRLSFNRFGGSKKSEPGLL